MELFRFTKIYINPKVMLNPNVNTQSASDEEIKNQFIRPLKRYGIVLKTFLFPS